MKLLLAPQPGEVFDLRFLRTICSSKCLTAGHDQMSTYRSQRKQWQSRRGPRAQFEHHRFAFFRSGVNRAAPGHGE